ncbi:sugar transferase [Pleurocapsales cyanobacterium LEGE 10410]|nr:sugar transferase [Pleurocapsales cyanobacterium LEGE 10410]
MAVNILLQTSKVLTLNLDSSRLQSYLPACALKWRQKNLWVESVSNSNGYTFPALTRKQWLEQCLRNSWLKRVCIDLNVGAPGIKLWADTCHQAGKPIFLRIPSNSYLPSCKQTTYWRVKRVIDWLTTVLLLAILSPIMVFIALMIKIFTPGPVFSRQWRVGARGKLFRIYKFRTMTVDAELNRDTLMNNQKGWHKHENDPHITSIGKWLRKYSIDELPQLFNVVRGEMSLVGPRPWALYDALRLGKPNTKRLNALPGITGAWQVKGRSKLMDLDSVTKCDLDYLSDWSLVKDLKILLMTVPRVLSGFGAY